MSSSQHLSRREVDDLKPSIDKAIYRCLGYTDSSLLSTATSCLTNGYDRRKMADKLSSIVDSKKASRIADRIAALAEEVGQKSSSSRKREREERGRDEHGHKRSRQDGRDKEKKEHTTNGSSKDATKVTEQSSEAKQPAADGSVGAQMAVLSADKIRLMMVTAQKEIEERKKALSVLKGEDTKAPVVANAAAVSAARVAAAQIKTQIHQAPGASMPPPGVIKPMLYSQPTTTVFSREDYEKQRRMAELQATIQSKLSALTGGRTAQGADPGGPRPLLLDGEGRPVDGAGRQVELPHLTPTLKANIRAKKREELKAQLGSRGPALEQEEAPWFDSRVSARPALRTKRALRFHEPGKFQQMAERIRMKAQLEKLQSEISQIARKTGISSATKLALLAPDSEDDDEVPDLEWWDSVILMTDEEREAAAARGRALGAVPAPRSPQDADDILRNIKEEAISNLVEHPTQLQPPSEPNKPVYMPVFLTKRERKKLRRQTRREAWKEEQEKVRLGLEAPAEPKLRISNLMRVLGSEAVQDPTRIEAHVREQMAKRKRAHEEANAARKLTREQRGERRAARLKEDTSLGVQVGVYRIRDLFECASKKFKVEKNLEQLYMTGCVVLHRGCCVVITEGGPKQHAKFKRLMLQRIKWSEDTVKDADGNPSPNSCTLVWEGAQVGRCFGEVKFKVCPTERAAREHLARHGAHHFWGLAYSDTLMAEQQQ